MSDQRLFKASVKNHIHYVSDGALDAEFYVIAPDFMSAHIRADSVVCQLKEDLKTHKSIDGLRLRSLSEIGDVADDIIVDHMPETESWAERAARGVKEKSL